MASRAEVEGALEQARRFVVERQRSNGEFTINMHLHNDAGERVREHFDSSPFTTMYLSLAVLADPAPEVARCVERAVAFLESEVNGAGIWRYFGRSSHLCAISPCDTDSTSGTLLLRQMLGLPVPNTRWMLVENRDVRGRFYTWFTPGIVASWRWRYWWFVLRDLNLGRAWFVWRRSWAHRRDRDVVINANVVRFLGEGDDSAGAIQWILETVRLGEEERRDKWYHDRSTLYHSMGRAFRSGVRAFGEARDTIAARIEERSEIDGRIGGCALHTALSTAALLYFEQTGKVIDRAVDYLVASQDEEGAWPAHALFYGGLARLAWWGSRETTTAFAIEALNLYRRSLDA